MTKNIIIKTSVQKRFDSFMVHGRVLFFSAPCGFGKTVLADALLRGRNVLRQSAADPDCAIPPSEQDWDILLIDDLQLMQEEAGQQALCELIRSSPERRFVLLSRGVPPGCLTAFQYTGLMTVLEADDLLFDADDVRRMFQLSGVNVTDSEIDGILKESVGYPLGVAITARCMSPNKPWTPELVARVFHEVLRECFAERGLTRFLPNMDAMLCRIDMHTGDLDAADAWYREKAPPGADAFERHAALPVPHAGNGGNYAEPPGRRFADALTHGAVHSKLRPHHRRRSTRISSNPALSPVRS